MFRKPPNQAANAAAYAALDAACARNATISVIRPELADEMPHARGRLLKRDKHTVTIDALQVIGRDTRIHRDHEIDAFFTHDDHIYTFRTTVKSAAEPTRLDNGVLIPAVSLRAPNTIKPGQRRNAFRVSLASINPPIQLELFDRNGADPANADAFWLPSTLEAPHFKAHLVNASDKGIAAIVRDCPNTRFQVFDLTAARFTIPATDTTEQTQLTILAEVRRSEQLADSKAEDTRLGLATLRYHNDNDLLTLRKYLNTHQRTALKRRRPAA